MPCACFLCTAGEKRAAKGQAARGEQQVLLTLLRRGSENFCREEIFFGGWWWNFVPGACSAAFWREIRFSARIFCWTSWDFTLKNVKFYVIMHFENVFCHATSGIKKAVYFCHGLFQKRKNRLVKVVSLPSLFQYRIKNEFSTNSTEFSTGARKNALRNNAAFYTVDSYKMQRCGLYGACTVFEVMNILRRGYRQGYLRP